MHTNIQSIAHIMAMGSIISDVELFECEGGLFGKYTVQLALRSDRMSLSLSLDPGETFKLSMWLTGNF